MPALAPTVLRRPNYFDGMELGLADFVSERGYFDALRGLYNRNLHTWGIAAGLELAVRGDQRSLSISPGMAIDPRGREILAPTGVVLSAPALSSQAVDVFVSVQRSRAGLSQSSLATGYKRIDQEAEFSFIPYGASVDPQAVFLGAAVMDAKGRIVGLQLDARRHCGFQLGALGFREPGGGDIGARFAAVANGDTADLAIHASELCFQGEAEIAGGLTIGGQHPRALLDVESGAAVLVSVTGQEGQSFLATGQDRQTAIGAAAASARLTVDGDIGLDAGRWIGFDTAGALQNVSAQHAFNLNSTPGQPMTFVEAGRIDLIAGATGATPETTPVTVTFLPNGYVGIGDPNPAQALTVAGPVQSLTGGFEFGAKGGIQTTAANSTTVRIGSIIDWWPGGAKAPPPQYQICDGKPITATQSPLKGQNTPNLAGIYIRGTTDYGEIKVTGGTPNHTHEIEVLPPHTHLISHSHVNVSVYTESDDGPGDSDTTDSKCSSTDHVHPIDIEVQQCAETMSQPNAGVVSGVTDAAANTPQSVGLVKLMRIY